MNIDEKKLFFVREFPDEGIIKPQSHFENENKLYLEIGSGKGEFIAQVSVRYPQINFLGIELKVRRITTICKKLDPSANSNVRIIQHYVNKELIERFEPESLDRIYIFHPDPWPKKRHHKKRLIQADFLESIRRVLKINGELYISTDFEEYAVWIIDHFKANPNYQSFFENGYSREAYPEHIETYFEVKHKKLGAPPYYMKYVKIR